MPGLGRSPGGGNGNPLWEIPWTEEPGRLQSLGSQRVGHDRVTEQAHSEIQSQVCPPGESSSGYEEGSETPGSSSPSHAFQKSDHALWPFCALASAPLKDRKQLHLTSPPTLREEPNASFCLHFSEVTNSVSGSRFLQGSNFCLHM